MAPLASALRNASRRMKVAAPQQVRFDFMCVRVRALSG